MSKDLFSDAPWNFAAPLSTLRTLPGLFGFKTGWLGRYHSLSDRLSTLWASATSITYPLFRCSLMVLVYFSLRCSSLANRFSRDFIARRRRSNYLGAWCRLLPTTFRHRISGHCVRWYSQGFREPLRLLQILSRPACLPQMIQCRTMPLLDLPTHCRVRYSL